MVAAVAAAQSNREIAAELFLSPKTIEFHLRQIYRKLGVLSRTARRVADRALSTRDAPGALRGGAPYDRSRWGSGRFA